MAVRGRTEEAALRATRLLRGAPAKDGAGEAAWHVMGAVRQLRWTPFIAECTSATATVGNTRPAHHALRMELVMTRRRWCLSSINGKRGHPSRQHMDDPSCAEGRWHGGVCLDARNPPCGDYRVPAVRWSTLSAFATNAQILVVRKCGGGRGFRGHFLQCGFAA